VISIAHLGEAERMFVVTLVLNEILSWVRSQPGTSSLRAILYMDEMFGYLPPTAQPPSKRPLLTLLKQARAYGLGCVLATQNPVDLDYKALSNAGTWFLGRLQTERDKDRVLAGLEGASATSGQTFDRRKIEATLAGLTSRVFLMRNVHEDQATVFHTRWAMSYLRGPLTLDQIATLERSRPAPASPVARPAPIGDGLESTAPVPPAGVRQLHLARRGEGGQTVYRPALLAEARIHFIRSRQKVDTWHEVTLLAPLPDEGNDIDWERALELAERPTRTAAVPEARYAPLPATALRAASWKSWPRRLAADLYRRRSLTLWRAPELRATSQIGDTESQFRVRLRERLREDRDRTIEKLRKSYGPKLTRVRDRIRRAEERVAKEKSQYRHQKAQTAVSIGATILGALFGRKLTSRGTIGRATTSARGANRAARELEDIERARREVAEQHRKLLQLEDELTDKLDELRNNVDVDAIELEALTIRPRKADTDVHRLTLAWVPWRVSAGGLLERDHDSGTSPE